MENIGDEVITIEAFATLHMPNGTSELTRVSGAWVREFTPERNALLIGLSVFEGCSLQTSDNGNPFFMFNRPNQA